MTVAPLHDGIGRRILEFLSFVLALAHTASAFSTPTIRARRNNKSNTRSALTARHAAAAPSNHQGGSLPPLPDIRAAVIVPGFLTGKDEFLPLAASLNDMGIPAAVVPMPNWHWLPCLGGRSMRPMLERIDFTVRHLAGVAGNLGDFDRTAAEGLGRSLEGGAPGMGEVGTEDEGLRRRQTTLTTTTATDPQLLIPNFSYSPIDCYQDFRNNPGGVLEVGGSAEVDEYPRWDPRGSFPAPPEPAGRVALIGHSAGGWICRAYLSGREYGGKSYDGKRYVHSLITLGSPHGNAPGPAFKGVEWVNGEVMDSSSGVRALAVAGRGEYSN